MRRLRIALAACLLSTLVGCATVTKMESGEQVINQRLLVNLSGPWNQFDQGIGGRTSWTIDGFAVDLLQFYVGIKNGEVVRRVPTSSGREQRPVTFRSGMQPHEIVAMYQTVATADGSSFRLQKLEPADFVGVRGFRFEFEVVRKFDEVRLSGVGYGAVRNGELFAITYTAPRLGFFQRYAAQVESMAKSARVRS